MLPKSIIDELIIAKKNSTMQTKTAGHIGMEAYMRNICARNGIVNALGGGIQCLSEEHSLTLRSYEIDEEQLKTGRAAGCEFDTYKMSNEVNKKDIILQTHRESVSMIENSKLPCASGSDDVLFQRTCIDHFWECKNCASVPFYWRASGSVILSLLYLRMITLTSYALNGTQRIFVKRIVTMIGFLTMTSRIHH